MRPPACGSARDHSMRARQIASSRDLRALSRRAMVHGSGQWRCDLDFWLVAHVGGPPHGHFSSLADISLARRRRRLYLADGLDAEDAEHTGALSAVQGVRPYAQHSLTVSRPRDISDAPQRSSTARGAICARVSKSWQGRSLRLPALLPGIGVGLAACGTPFPSPPRPATRSTKSEST